MPPILCQCIPKPEKEEDIPSPTHIPFAFPAQGYFMLLYCLRALVANILLPTLHYTTHATSPPKPCQAVHHKHLTMTAPSSPPNSNSASNHAPRIPATRPRPLPRSLTAPAIPTLQSHPITASAAYLSSSTRPPLPTRYDTDRTLFALLEKDARRIRDLEITSWEEKQEQKEDAQDNENGREGSFYTATSGACNPCPGGPGSSREACACRNEEVELRERVEVLEAQVQGSRDMEEANRAFVEGVRRIRVETMEGWLRVEEGRRMLGVGEDEA